MLLKSSIIKIATQLASQKSPRTENSPIRGASLKKNEIFYGYFDIFGHPKWDLEKYRDCITLYFSIIT